MVPSLFGLASILYIQMIKQILIETNLSKMNRRMINKKNGLHSSTISTTLQDSEYRLGAKF